jgi:heme oxygenase
MGESWMLARLRRETALYQQAADVDRLAVVKDTVSRADYLSFLSRIYGFEAPVVAALAMTSSLQLLIELRGSYVRQRLLRSDLIALGVEDPLQLPRCASITPFSSVAEALGWLYVLERNALMHGMIERQLGLQLPWEIGIAGAYLAAPEPAPGARWRELGVAMDRCARRVHDADNIVSVARAAFRSQHRWYAAIPSRRVA